MLTLYNVTSADGYIARKDGSEDFIPDDFWPPFLELCQQYGALVMGRKTYEAIQKYDDNLLKSLEDLAINKIVISNNTDLNLKAGYQIVRSPEEALVLAPNALVSSGPGLNNYLLRNGMVMEIILKKLPDSIGEGLKPFNEKLLAGIPIRII